MTKISIEGIYRRTGEHLIRQADSQVLHIQLNPAKPKAGRPHPKELLILVRRTGERIRISGLFEVRTATDLPQFSCDFEGLNYRLKFVAADMVSIEPKTKKSANPEKAGRVLAFSGKKLAALPKINLSNQLELWQPE